MSHEFKTPISTINLAIDSVLNSKNIIDKKKIDRYLSVVKEENKRMQDQVENILKISQLERDKNISDMRNENLHSIISNAINHFSLIVKSKKGSIRTNLNAENTICSIVKIDFTNALINIIDNGIKYSVGPPQILIKTQNINNTLIIEIIDKGIGMSKKTQKMIFEKFFREETGDIHNVRGHGIGLTFVKKVINLVNAKIFVDSQLGYGSNFKIEIPLSLKN